MKSAHSKILVGDASGVRAPYTVCSPLRAGPKWKFESISFIQVRRQPYQRIDVHPRPLTNEGVAGCSALLGRPRASAESQPLDISEFAEIAVERAEGHVTRFPSNLQNQAV